MKFPPTLAILALFVGSAAAQDIVLYQSDFEADDGGLVVTTGTAWEHGVPSSGPGAAHSGTKCWATGLAGQPPASVRQGLALPTLDASVAPGANAILVSWWQYFDDPPLVFPNPFYIASVSAYSGASNQPLFGRVYGGQNPAPAHVGWRRVEVVLGKDAMTSSLSINISYQGNSSDGMYVDDIKVEAVRLTTISVEDFEAGQGGFTGTWQYGTQGGCPLPVSAPSGTMVWSTGITSCSYSHGEELLSPVIDLTQFREHEKVYVSWNRFALMESIADGVEHEVSYDGGPFETTVGFHSDASAVGGAFGDATVFGLALDPSRGATAQLRWRVTTDSSEWEYSMWIDDFAVSVREALLGSGLNPPGSLAVTSGDFRIAGTTTLALDDPSGAFPGPANGLLLISFAGDPNLPLGTPLAGLGLGAQGSSGDALIALAAPLGRAWGSQWSPGSPSIVTLAIPNQVSLIGLEGYLQGALLSTTQSRTGLTTGLFVKLGL
ncbi:MAG TPA: hypothetical protein ENJ09_04965 [Planctomycetes bacterium]|nr:hypothetical protein [Planctomycetota bacterium]